MELKKTYIENALSTMDRMPDKFVDLTLTSPPYDDMRTYKGHSAFPFHAMADKLYRVTKENGVVVWVVADQTIDGSETGSSFKQALYFQEIGFNLFKTILYQKKPRGAVGNNKGYWQIFEYMFAFCRGDAPKKFAPPIDQPRHDVWTYQTGRGHSTKDEIAFKHPAIFPEKLAADHIRCWTDEGDLVYDPMAGSGTVPKVSAVLKRNWVASEIAKEYSTIIHTRIGLSSAAGNNKQILF